MDVRPLPRLPQAYLDAEYEAVRFSVGGYRFEGMGAQLFDEVEGSHFAILGLPLLPLLAYLRDARRAAKLMGIPYAEVIGDPVAHSKSPVIHKFGWRSSGSTATIVRPGSPRPSCGTISLVGAPIRTGAAQRHHAAGSARPCLWSTYRRGRDHRRGES